MRHDSIKLNWELGYTTPDGSGSLKWTEAKVPGAVQRDVANSEGYGPHFYAENWRDYLWMEDCSFIYRCGFYQPKIKVGERLFFISKGIDYTFGISFNSLEIHQQEGMFTPVQLDLTDYLDEKNELLVKIFPVPKKQPEPVDHRQAAASVKPAVSYGWDWHPRLIPSPSSVEILQRIIPPDELWPPAPGASWESHHAYNAWEGDTWLMKDMIDDYFGESRNLAELVANGQMLQCEGYKAIYEESRRQKPYCSMALNWCFNEPWPSAANNSSSYTFLYRQSP